MCVQLTFYTGTTVSVSTAASGLRATTIIEWLEERHRGRFSASQLRTLAAPTMESTVDSALALLLETGQPFDYATVKELANPAPPRGPALSLSGVPNLRVYDSLLAGVA